MKVTVEAVMIAVMILLVQSEIKDPIQAGLLKLETSNFEN